MKPRILFVFVIVVSFFCLFQYALGEPPGLESLIVPDVTVYSRDFNKAYLGLSGDGLRYWSVHNGRMRSYSPNGEQGVPMIYTPDFKISRSDGPVYLGWTMSLFASDSTFTSDSWLEQGSFTISVWDDRTSIGYKALFQLKYKDLANNVPVYVTLSKMVKNSGPYYWKTEEVLKTSSLINLPKMTDPQNECKNELKFVLYFHENGDIGLYYTESKDIPASGPTPFVYRNILKVSDISYAIFNKVSFKYTYRCKQVVQVNIDDLKVAGGKDTTAPVSSHNYPDDDKWINHPVVIQLYGNDRSNVDLFKNSGSGVKRTDYTINNSLVQTGNVIKIDTDGIYMIQYWSTDQLNNVEAPKTILVKLDRTAPVTRLNLSSIPNAVGWNDAPVTVNFIKDNSGSGTKEIRYTINGGPVQTGDSMFFDVDGSYMIQYGATDNVGNVEATKSLYIKLDRTAPVTQANLTSMPDASGWNNEPVKLIFTPSDFFGSGIKQINYKINDSEIKTGNMVSFDMDGIYRVQYWSTDQAGNDEITKTIVVKLDRTAPVTTANQTPAANAAGWNNTPVKLDFSAIDNNSGFKETHYQVGGGAEQIGNSININMEGTQEVQYWSLDQAGNAETPHKTITVKLDQTAPVIINLQPVNGVAVNGPMVNISAKLSDSISTINPGSVRIILDGTDCTISATVIAGADGSVTYRLTKNLTVGDHQVIVKAADRAGNQAQTGSSFVVN